MAIAHSKNGSRGCPCCRRTIPGEAGGRDLGRLPVECFRPEKPEDFEEGAYRKTDDIDLLPKIRSLVDERPSYGYRRIHRPPVRSPFRAGKTPVNHKRIYRIRKQNHLLLPRHSGTRSHPMHGGIVRTTRSNRRWCSYVFEISCPNGEIVRVAFAPDCCDREVLSSVATTGSVFGGLIQNRMGQALAARFGRSESLPHPIEWLSDNGSCYTAKETREFA